MTTRNQYSKEFKLDAISLVVEQGYSRAEAAHGLEINANMLGRWLREHEAPEGHAEPDRSQTETLCRLSERLLKEWTQFHRPVNSCWPAVS